jgi:hypothetical protein
MMTASSTLRFRQGEIEAMQMLLDMLEKASILPSKVYLYIKCQFISKFTPITARGGKLGELNASNSTVFSLELLLPLNNLLLKNIVTSGIL